MRELLGPNWAPNEAIDMTQERPELLRRMRSSCHTRMHQIEVSSARDARGGDVQCVAEQSMRMELQE